MTAAVGRPEPQGAVAVVGFMGAGKSAVGRALAEVLGLPFTDTDDLVTRIEGPIDEIFARRGEAAFRATERDVAAAAAARALAVPGVLSLGGGAVLSREVREAIGRLPHVVWLTASPDVLWARVRASGLGKRPLARDREGFERLLGVRAPLYRDVATLVVENDGDKDPKALAAEIAEALRASGGRGEAALETPGDPA